jgi:hypothetical protein
VRSEAFWDHLQDRYDGPQLAAILGTAAHVMGGETAGQQQQLAAAAQGAAAAAAQPRRSSSSGGGSRSSSSSSPPVTLIQGPPGTGKTYTVLGVLNLWHMVLYHRHYASLDGVVQRLVDGWLPGERIGGCGQHRGCLACWPRVRTSPVSHVHTLKHVAHVTLQTRSCLPMTSPRTWRPALASWCARPATRPQTSCWSE